MVSRSWSNMMKKYCSGSLASRRASSKTETDCNSCALTGKRLLLLLFFFCFFCKIGKNIYRVKKVELVDQVLFLVFQNEMTRIFSVDSGKECFLAVNLSIDCQEWTIEFVLAIYFFEVMSTNCLDKVLRDHILNLSVGYFARVYFVLQDGSVFDTRQSFC